MALSGALISSNPCHMWVTESSGSAVVTGFNTGISVSQFTNVVIAHPVSYIWAVYYPEQYTALYMAWIYKGSKQSTFKEPLECLLVQKSVFHYSLPSKVAIHHPQL